MADQVMERLGILHLKEKKCSEISGGELQMVLIARALASQPRILVLDEPESNLDFKNQLIVLETLSRLAAEGMICLFNTHYPAHALQRAGKSFLLCKDGSSIFGPTREVGHRSEHPPRFRGTGGDRRGRDAGKCSAQCAAGRDCAGGLERNGGRCCPQYCT